MPPFLRLYTGTITPIIWPLRSSASVRIKPIWTNPSPVGWLLSPFVGASSRVSESSSLFRLFIALGGDVGGDGGWFFLVRCISSTRTLKSLLSDESDEKLSLRCLNECRSGGVIGGGSCTVASCLGGDGSSRATCAFPSGKFSGSPTVCSVFLGDRSYLACPSAASLLDCAPSSCGCSRR